MFLNWFNQSNSAHTFQFLIDIILNLINFTQANAFIEMNPIGLVGIWNIDRLVVHECAVMKEASRFIEEIKDIIWSGFHWAD